MAGAVGEAPGKILLIGEHAVVYGHPAIAVPLRGVKAQATVEFTRNGGIEMLAPDLGEHIHGIEEASPRLRPLVGLAASVMQYFREEQQGLRIELKSTIPISRGMGSGAAAAVALVRAICNALDRRLDSEQVSDLAMQSEKAYHGTPSGVDSAVVSMDKPIYFVKGKPIQDISVGRSVFHFLVADTGITSPTAEVVEDVRKGRESDRARYDSFFWEIGSMASVAREVLRTGSPEELGLCMNHAQRVLQSLGVSCTELDDLMAAALDNGAVGAKLSGAGKGGAIIALLEDDAEPEPLADKLRAAGAEHVLTTVLGAETAE